jgi:hypothetical protein
MNCPCPKRNHMSGSEGVLFFRKVNGELGYYENGDDDQVDKSKKEGEPDGSL